MSTAITPVPSDEIREAVDLPLDPRQAVYVRHDDLTALVAETEALREVVRFFFVENAEHINGGRTVHDDYKVWVNGEKGYLSPAAADAIDRALGNGSSSEAER